MYLYCVLFNEIDYTLNKKLHFTIFTKTDYAMHNLRRNFNDKQHLDGHDRAV